MNDISIRKVGNAGRITLQRPQSLNAMTYEMACRIEAALEGWTNEPAVKLIIFDALGDRAFCSGGDIAELYETGTRGDYAYGQTFWADEYRLNYKIFNYSKPIISFLQGFTMGGGVGIGCHGSHRIVGDSSQIAMPECGIGLIPDVGGSFMLALSPGRLGEYLGVTAARMNASDAIFAGFADKYISESKWPQVIEQLEISGDADQLTQWETSPPSGPLQDSIQDIDRHFNGASLGDILITLKAENSEFARTTLKRMHLNSPLSMACTIETLNRLRGPSLTLEKALDLEYRFTARSMEHGDFLEGIRAAIIDKDRKPKWQFSNGNVPSTAVSKMLMPLGKLRLKLRGKGMKIGFIGLGNMGAPMASNLANAGHVVTGFDIAGTIAAGVTIATNAIEASKDQDIVITMLPDGATLCNVAAKIIPVMRKGATLIDCSTVDVESARAVAADAIIGEILFVDAPVSGGISGASAGTLTFMAGGSTNAFEIAHPLFKIMGQKVVHCGDSGAGQAAKICNNMILGATMIATCEAFALADKLGLNRQKMFDVVSTSSGNSWTMNSYCPAPGIGPVSPADNEYKPGFAAELMLKDLGLSQKAAETVDADTPMGARALELYRQFVEDEGGKGMDFSAMLPRFSKRSRS